jgi:hypothetical protein
MTAICIGLIKKNYEYKSQNEKLILENDSIISVNMSLARELHMLKKENDDASVSDSNDDDQ